MGCDAQGLVLVGWRPTRVIFEVKPFAIPTGMPPLRGRPRIGQAIEDSIGSASGDNDPVAGDTQRVEKVARRIVARSD